MQHPGIVVGTRKSGARMFGPCAAGQSGSSRMRLPSLNESSVRPSGKRRVLDTDRSLQSPASAATAPASSELRPPPVEPPSTLESRLSLLDGAPPEDPSVLGVASVPLPAGGSLEQAT